MNDLLDGALDAAIAVSLSEHLELCEPCREEYCALKRVQQLLRSAPVPDGRAARRRAEASLRAAIGASMPVRRRPILLPAALSLGLAAVVLCVVMLRPGRPVTTLHGPPPMMMEVASVSGLPTAGELDEMTSLHAQESVSVAPGDAGSQQDTLADSTSRIPYGAN
jgi:anti-sigma factor RsiW